jgi:hypothetical protein
MSQINESLMSVRNYIDREWAVATQTDWLDVVDPATLVIIARLP